MLLLFYSFTYKGDRKMFTRKHLIYAIFFALAIAVLPAHASLTLPNYAAGGGNLTSDLQSKGKAVTDIISMVVAILAIMGILIGAGKIGVGKGEEGKQWVVGGIVALVIAGSVYGIASLVT
jgi:hypothetical protein